MPKSSDKLERNPTPPGSKIKVDFKLKHHFCWCSKCDSKLRPCWWPRCWWCTTPKEKIKVDFKLKQPS